MSYSTSERSLKKVEEFLTTLANLRGESVSWTTSDPNNLAYKIRQGMKIAEDRPDAFPAFKDLKKIFKISVKAGVVTAERFIPLVEMHEAELTAANFKKTVSVFKIPSVTEVMEVIGSLVANPGYEEYEFTDYTEPSDKDLATLYKWTSKNEFFLVKGSCVILTKSKQAEEISWNPMKATA